VLALKLRAGNDSDVQSKAAGCLWTLAAGDDKRKVEIRT
jgi:hypothetical protein